MEETEGQRENSKGLIVKRTRRRVRWRGIMGHRDRGTEIEMERANQFYHKKVSLKTEQFSKKI